MLLLAVVGYRPLSKTKEAAICHHAKHLVFVCLYNYAI